MRIRMPGGVRGLTGTTAMIAAAVLALAGCGDGDGTDGAAERPAAATTTTQSGSPAPEPSPTTQSPTPAPAPTPTPAPVTLSDHTGGRVGTAVAAARKAGLGYTVRLEGTGRTASSWGAGEKVCEQTDGSDGVTFTVPRDGRDCDGRLLHTPKPTPTPQPEQPRDTGGSGGSGGGGTAGCELTSPAGNCYADGQFCATKHRGLSTHGRGGEYLTCSLDSGGRWRWSDGVAG
ncbi:hypothetical protein ACFUV2_15265 [Streptomyces pilosus]|uniref:hypothetical protein n=1 Tax=Streptomyces pilosus TaxID=28893 RepID=UPI003640350E